jgi:hypothetical protein
MVRGGRRTPRGLVAVDQSCDQRERPGSVNSTHFGDIWASRDAFGLPSQGKLLRRRSIRFRAFILPEAPRVVVPPLGSQLILLMVSALVCWVMSARRINRLDTGQPGADIPFVEVNFRFCSITGLILSWRPSGLHRNERCERWSRSSIARSRTSTAKIITIEDVKGLRVACRTAFRRHGLTMPG